MLESGFSSVRVRPGRESPSSRRVPRVQGPRPTADIEQRTAGSYICTRALAASTHARRSRKVNHKRQAQATSSEHKQPAQNTRTSTRTRTGTSTRTHAARRTRAIVHVAATASAASAAAAAVRPRDLRLPSWGADRPTDRPTGRAGWLAAAGSGVAPRVVHDHTPCACGQLPAAVAASGCSISRS